MSAVYEKSAGTRCRGSFSVSAFCSHFMHSNDEQLERVDDLVENGDVPSRGIEWREGKGEDGK